MKQEVNEMYYDTNQIKTAYRNYLDYIAADYKAWQNRLAAKGSSGASAKIWGAEAQRHRRLSDMYMNFVKNLSFKVGKKYVKCFNKDGGVHSFIVNVHDDPKFKFGDILKPASYAAPAKNFARGNIFTTYDRITWSGA
jgi:hypothetical protein